MTAGESRKRQALFGVFHRTKQLDSVRTPEPLSDRHHRFRSLQLASCTGLLGLTRSTVAS